MHRLRVFLYLFFFVAFVSTSAHAQSDRPAKPPQPNLEAFAPLDLPEPNDFRSGAGRPGVDYWQQRANYQIDVTLDPEANRISGAQTITYTNNAPQELHRLWVQLDQNLFKPDSRGAKLTDPSDRFSGAFSEGGFDITNVEITHNGETVSPEFLIEDTRMRITLPEPLAANGGTLELSLDFAFTIPEYGADRMGRLDVEDGTIYQLAQWYPRMYVYDDLRGWDPLPYLGQGEWYLEFGTFDVNITVPRDFIVVSTGELLNPEDVLTAEQRRRMERARSSRETVAIIDSTEVGQPGTRPDGSGPLTWRYRAEDVRDFAWAASQAFIWDAAEAKTGDGAALAMSAYPKESIGTEQNPGWEESTRYTQHSIEFYSEAYHPYPYPVAINVAGVVGGMEYPQIVFCSWQARGRSLFGVTDHEFGHEWFPMMVASNERRHVWMDEGLNSFMNVYSTDAFYGDDAQQSFQQLAQLVARAQQSPMVNTPIATRTDLIRGELLGYLGYRKPAAGLVLLREYVLGPERFDSAFREYIDRWIYKHPQPADFFRTMEDVSGENLDWFWRGWFIENDNLDQAVASVQPNRDSTRTLITIASQDELMMPVEAQLTFADGSTEMQRVPVEAFFTSDVYTISVDASRQLQRVRLDPRGMLPDVNPDNDTWTREASTSGTDSASDGASSPEGQ